MKIRSALLFCLLLSGCFPQIGLSRGHGILTSPLPGTETHGTLFPGTYLGRAAKYTVAATVQTNGTISVSVYDKLTIVPTDELITGVGINPTNRLVYVSFGESGYLEGRVNLSRTKIMARTVLRTADKVITRRCVLKWVDPNSDPGHGLVIVIQLPEPIGSAPAGLSREEAEAFIELARQRLQQPGNPGSATILPPTSFGDFLAPPPPAPPAP